MSYSVGAVQFIPRLTARESRIPHLLNAIAARQAILHHSPNHRSLRASKLRNASTLPQAPGTVQPLLRKPEIYDDDDPADTRRKIPTMLFATSIFGFLVSIYISYVFFSYRAALKKFSESPAAQELQQNSDVTNRYNNFGRDFDDEVEMSEWMMGIAGKRRKMVKEAMKRGGKILEVGCGTGRNLQYFDLVADRQALPESGRRGRLNSITFNDKSTYMVSVAERKYGELMEKPRRRRSNNESDEVPVEFVVGDAGLRGIIKRPENGFDTIIQTMGICSITDPVSYLRTLGKLLRQPSVRSTSSRDGSEDSNCSKTEMGSEDDGGRILLLEHGRGYYDWLNRFLDNGAKMHADRYGCWWNKDIGNVVKEVEKFGDLKVESVKRYHLGTTWQVVLKPVPRDPKNLDPIAMRKEVVLDESNAKGKAGGWSW